MTQSHLSSGPNQRLARILVAAVDKSGRPRREIAREVGLNKATFLRVLRGERAISLDEAERILMASGTQAHAPVMLALAGEDALASKWLGEEMGAFLDGFLASLPRTLDETLGERTDELNPRWAAGASHLVAKMLAKHIDDIAERDLSAAFLR